MKDLLPIGSVVLLKNAKKKLMVCGRIQVDLNSGEEKIYHYSGCLYPEGLIDPDKLFLFNNEDIERVYSGTMLSKRYRKTKPIRIRKIYNPERLSCR